MKNIKLLKGKPLICYSIDVAKALAKNEDICISTDNDAIIKVVESYGISVPFKRPSELSTDTATSNDVLLHAIEFYENIGRKYDLIVLLQPTSPLRTVDQVKESLLLYNENIDMVVSVRKSHASAVICKENKEGFLESCFNNEGKRRQDIDSFYEYNGAIYIISVNKLKQYSLSGLKYIKKYVMDEISSIDIDTPLDWKIVECLI